METTICINNLHLYAFHGVLEQEHSVGNDYRIDCQITVDFSQAMRTDDVCDTINYAEAYQVVSEVMLNPCNLLERVAWLIADALLRRFPTLEAADVSVTKLNPPMGAHCDGAEVRIKVTRDHELCSLS